MSVSGSLMGYGGDNNCSMDSSCNGGGKKSKALLNVTTSSKQCSSLNSSMSNSVVTSASSNAAKQQQRRTNCRQPQQMLAKHRLHLNTLWSIWYGILVTLFQGYLVVQGAHRFLSCTLITWKMDEPSLELDIQLILCGVVVLCLPLFLASSLFKVGNFANDGFKLGNSEKSCSAQPDDGLEEEATGGTLRTLWTHGGPTSSFIHIMTALCLLVPRLLLESRLIQDGFLPRENIWRTELDFMVTHKDRLVVLSFMTQPYQNLSTEHPNQSISDLIDTRFLNPNVFDESRVIEKYREEYEEDDMDDDLYDLSNPGLDNESAITFSTGSSNNFSEDYATDPTKGYQNPIKIESTLETTVEITTFTPSVTSQSSSKRGRHGKKGSKQKNRNRGKGISSSEEDRRYEIKSDEIEFDKFDDASPIFEGVQPQQRPKKPNSRRTTTENPTFDPPRSTRGPKRVKDSNIHILKPERVPENALPSTPVSTNSKIYEIKPSPAGKNLSRKSREHSAADLEFEIQSVDEDDFIIRDEETGEIVRPSYLQAVPENISLEYKELHGVAGFIQRILGNQEVFDQTKWHHIPSLEFLNLALALLVWSVRYPSVFWNTSKTFSIIFSIQMVANALDILLCYAGVSVLYKHDIVADRLPMNAPPLLLNGCVTIALFLLAVLLIISSSMILYLYGHGRLTVVMRDRRMITIKGDVWSYFAHCASFCFVLAVAVVKAPIMHDLSATYKGSLDGAVLAAALGSVIHIFVWIVLWLGLTAKRRWVFKLPPMESPSVMQPLLTSPRGDGGTTSDGSGDEVIYWPKIGPSSPKLKVTFNEVPSTSDEVNEHGGKRCTSNGGQLRVSTTAGEPDDGDYATLRGPNGDLLHLSHHITEEYMCNDHADDTSEEGKLLECVRDDSVTYASTRDLEPPMSSATMSPANSYITSPEHMMSPLAPVSVTVHSNEVHLSSATPRLIRRADSGMPAEALTPRSDTETESSTSPPERASSESSGVHSSEETKDEVVIRPRSTPYKSIIKPAQPAIQEEPFGRSTNMRMSSFIADTGGSSATLPIVRNNNNEQLKQELPYCSTMPLPPSHHHPQYKPQLYTPQNGSKAQIPQHTTLPNGIMNQQSPYQSSAFLRRMPQNQSQYASPKQHESPYAHGGHRTFSKLINDPLNNMPPPPPPLSSFASGNSSTVTLMEDRDSANYSMISDQDREMYMNATQLQQLQHQQQLHHQMQMQH
ncbi:protein tincar [Culicoides brevitarsis]|uniref:protein tincar n=1 Tax=Culicoides brevitarsis TaxID=469753 RepID=UPI00307C2736